MAQQIPFKAANPPANWSGNIGQLVDLLRQLGYVEVPDTFLVGTVGAATPPDNSGPWLKNGTDWYVWDVASGTYIPIDAHVAVGRIELFAYAAIDLSRYVPCDGSAIPRATPYDILFNKIGIKFGGGDGSTTFNVPDLRGRAPIGAGTGSIKVGAAPAAPLTTRALGDLVGEEAHAMVANEATLLIANTNTAGGAAGSVTANGAIVPHNNMQPSTAIQFAIRYA